MLPSNQLPSPTQPSPATIGRFRRLFERGTDLLQRRRLIGIDRNHWINAVRYELRLMYGYGRHDIQLDHFAHTPADSTDEEFRGILSGRVEHLRRFIESLEALLEATKTPLLGKRIFIGHGRSPLWRELKDLINERLGLPWDEFNREAVAGITTSERLHTMLAGADSPFL